MLLTLASSLKYLLVVWLVGTWSLLGMSPARAAEPLVVTLSVAPGGVSLVGRMGFLDDKQGDLAIADIRSPVVEAQFAVPSALVQQSSLERHVRWLKLHVRQTGQYGDWLIDTSNTASFNVYGPYDAEGHALAAPVVGGATLASAQPGLNGDRFLYRFRLDRPGDYTLYLRTASEFPEYYQWTAWDAVQFGQAEQGLSMYNGICYGLLFGMLIINLMLLAAFREPLYGYHFLACLFAMVAIAAINGHVGRYVLAGAPTWVPVVIVGATPLWILFATLFCRSFLQLPRYAPRVDRFLLASIPLCVLALVLALARQFVPGLVLTQALAVAVPALMSAGAVIALRHGFRPAAWYLAGLTALFVAAVGIVLSSFGVVKLPMHYGALQVGVVIEIIVLVIAMGSRIHLMHLHNGELGQKAARLVKDAETDPLTGLFNRKGWNRHGEQVLAMSSHAAVLLIDLDHFKPVNDQCGHAAGDKVLVSVAQRLQAQLRGNDLAARLGGDEFVVLLGDTSDREAVDLLVQRLIRLIALPVAFEGHQLRVGCSIGIARYPSDGRELSVLMHAADLAMYFVKKRGRGSSAFNEDTKPAPLTLA